ncbi:hypothetical protein BK133_03750 [Paenibacillus sp. FSL H8-0548]|nr:hypothetical protein BK133_03750 [Paenibacillus sp. FSL H8-0548]
MSDNRYQGTFFEYFSDFQDNRQEGKVYHRLTDILFIVVSGVLCGYDEWDDIYTWAKVPATGEWFKKYISLMNGISSLSTIKRGFSLIQPQEFSTRFIDWMGDAQGDWAKLTGVGMVKREVSFIADPTKTTTETAYYIGSVDDVTDFATAARKHWGIESMHWSLDVTFGDDRNQTRETAAAQNLAVVKRMVFNVLKNETKIQPKTSKPNKRIIAAADIDYHDHLINMAFKQM